MFYQQCRTSLIQTALHCLPAGLNADEGFCWWISPVWNEYDK